MAVTQGDPKSKENNPGDKEESKRGKSGKKDEKKDKSGEKDTNKREKSGKKENEKEYKPGMSYLYEPCPHRVWTPKPGEKDKAEPRGIGSPWYEPVRKKEDVEKEEAEKNKKKEDKAKKRRDKVRREKEKQKEEEDKKKKAEEDKKKEEDSKKEERKKKKEKEKNKKENEKRKQQKEEREKEKERKKKEEEEGKGKRKEKEKPQASYMYEPCPHRVYTPSPGEQDLGDPKGINSPWYIKPKRKEDVEKEEEDERKKDMKRRKEEREKRKREREEREKEQEEELRQEQEENEKREKERREKLAKEREEERKKRERIEREHAEMGAGVRDSRTDFSQEIIWIMDFISDVDEKEREKRGEALRWKKEEVENQIESYMAKEAFTKDFKHFIKTFVQAEWMKASKKLKTLEKDERRNRRELLKNMDPLAQDMVSEGKRFKTLYKAAKGEKEQDRFHDEKPSLMEDAMVNMIMQQLSKMDSTSLRKLC